METYIDVARQSLAEELPNEPDALLDLYLLLVLTLGESTAAEDIHDAWAVWASRENPGHKSVMPFSRLEPAVAHLDIPYRDAIHRAAQRLSVPQPS